MRSVMTENSFALDMVATYRQTLEGRLLDCNDACARMLGYSSREELLATGRFTFVNVSDTLSIAAALPDLTQLMNVELAIRKKDGSVAWVLQNLKLVEVEEASKVWIEAAMFDVTEQRVAAQRMEFQAYHDGLTALPNQSLAIDRLNVALARATRHHEPVAVMIIDLDHFELVNTTFGHGIADALLREVADRLAHCVRGEDTVCRFGSDEFMVVVAEMSSETDAAIAAQRMLASISGPVLIGGHSIDIKASIGISVSPSDGQSAESLIRAATQAMYQAKE